MDEIVETGWLCRLVLDFDQYHTSTPFTKIESIVWSIKQIV